MKTTLAVFLILFEFSIAQAEIKPVPRDQADGVVQAVLQALNDHGQLTCSIQGDHQNGAGSQIPLVNLIKFAANVLEATSPSLPTYEFVSPFGISQNSVIVTLSQDKRTLLSAIIISSASQSVQTMAGAQSTQLIPTSVSDCK